MAQMHAIGGDGTANLDTGCRMFPARVVLADDPLVIGPAAWGTALFFQQVHLTEVKGWTLVKLCRAYALY